MKSRLGARTARWALLCAGFWVAGCADDSARGELGGAAVELRVVRGSERVSTEVDREGVRLELEERAALTIERDVVRDPVDVELEVIAIDRVARPPLEEVLSPAVVVRPHGQKFERSVELEIPLEGAGEVRAADLRVLRLPDEESEDWEEVREVRFELGDDAQQLARVTTDRFSVYVCGSVAPPPQAVPALIVDAGPGQTVDEGSDVTLAGTLSGGEAAEASWSQLEGPVVTLTDADTLTPSFQAPAVSSDTQVVLQLSVAEVSDEVTILVRSTNQPPTVQAGPDQQVASGAVVSLMASASDPDGSVSVAWSQLSGEEVTLDDAAALSTGFTAPVVFEASDLVFEVVATDDDGAEARDTLTVGLSPAVPTPPTAEAGSDQTVDEQTAVELVGSHGAGDGSVVELAWTQIGGPAVGLSSSDPSAVGFNAPTVTVATALSFEYAVSDDLGLSASDVVTVTVLPVNAAPLVSAGGDQSLNEETQGALVGDASDADGSVASVQWTQLSGTPVTIDAPTQLVTTFTPPDVTVPVQLVFELEVTDDEGAAARDTVSFEVYPVQGTNRPPQTFAGPDLVAAQGSEVTFAPVVSDPDGDDTNLTYLWTQTFGPEVTLDDPTLDTPTFVAPSATCAQALAFALTVTDELGASTSDTIGVLVSEDLGSPVAIDTQFDFDADDGGFASEDGVWELGTPTSGPGVADSGGRVWATTLAGDYTDTDGVYALCMPPIDRAGAARMTLSFAAWVDISNGDAFRVEALDPQRGWQPLSEVSPAYQRASPLGWTNAGRNDLYSFHTVIVPGWATATPHLRFVLEETGNWVGPGAYLDSVAVYDEASDPDADGIPGIIDEYAVHGTDPFLFDSDGDGVGDGQEALTDGTDPLNPVEYASAVTVTAPILLDFEGGDGAFEAREEGAELDDPLRWQWGAPSSGPGVAHSGSNVWATNLAGDYGINERSHLYLPLLDLTDASDPTLSFRLWGSGANGDGMRVEYFDAAQGAWVGLPPAFPAYESTDALGHAAWRAVARQSLYSLVAIPLTDHVGEVLRVRLSMRSNQSWLSSGWYVDDVGLHEEGSDPDGDGLAGVIAEFEAHGSDPFVADTDGDGENDGDEVAEPFTDPLDGASYASGRVIQVGQAIDFDVDGGGFSVTSTINGNTLPDDGWEFGAPASGPGIAHTGTQVWATKLAGNYHQNEVSYLNLPPIDLSSASDPTLSFRMWSARNNGDAVRMEVYDEGQGAWVLLSPAFPGYDVSDAWGGAGWGSFARFDLYTLFAVPLDAYVGEVVRTRFVLTTNGSWESAGWYIDDVSVYEDGPDGDDPDADGIAGIVYEREQAGTDPFLGDTDGDGSSDGAELAAATPTDPLDPAYYPGVTMLVPGDLLDFEGGDGGLEPVRTVVDGGDPVPGGIWEYGAPASGPGYAYSGGSVWATVLSGNYVRGARDYLYLPPIDLSGASGPATLSFRLWAARNNGDGVSVEYLSDGGVWTQMGPTYPAYSVSDAAGISAWGSVGYLSNYELAILPLPTTASGLVRVRLVARTNESWEAAGWYLDDLAVNLESEDVDGDGIDGVHSEWTLYATDPRIADTDGDGESDGDEVEEVVDPYTDPLNPADHDGAVAITQGDWFDFDSGDDGFAAGEDALWELGTVASGPGTGFGDTRAWGTNLTGNYFRFAREALYVPPVSVTGTAPVLGFHLWSSNHNGDGLSVEIWDPELESWEVVPAAALEYQDLTNYWWKDNDPWTFAGVDLTSWIGETVRLRFFFESNGSWEAAGSYVDDVVLLDQATGDLDADGVSDGAEITAGTDPLDPASF